MKKESTPIRGVIMMKPHLYNFLTAKLHLDEDEPLAIPGKNSYADYLDTLLVNKSAIRDDRRHKLGEAYTEPLLFELGSKRAHRSDIFLTDTRTMRFNKFVHNRLHELLNELILQNLDFGTREVETINLFMKRFDLFGLITFDALKKSATRYRERHHLPRLSKKGKGKEAFFATASG